MLYELRLIDAWRDEDGWTWNTSVFEDNVYFEEPTTRRILKALRNWGYLKRGSTGKCTVVTDGCMYEVQDRRTNEPLYALMPLD